MCVGYLCYKVTCELNVPLSGRALAARASECSLARRRSSATLVVLCSCAANTLGPAEFLGVQQAHSGRQPVMKNITKLNENIELSMCSVLFMRFCKC